MARSDRNRIDRRALASGRATPDHYGHLDTHVVKWD
jgi:hypothetical protein